MAVRSARVRQDLISLAAALALLSACASGQPAVHGAQTVHSAPQRSSECTPAMEALGITTVPALSRLRASYDSVRHKTLVVLPPEPAVVPASYGVKGITGIMQPESRPPTALPDLQLDFLVLSPTVRPPEERIVRFKLDIADSITAGPGMAVSAPSSSSGALEHVSVLISARDLIRLLQAGTVRATLGSTEFSVTEGLRDGLRAMVLYVQCGAA